ncbi:cysteinyl leukotriene receptor 1-like [Ruditapes philippinarum]|uniref:cysteinyl leukotriene receptor 1-like n=1 Tax=Ruditapes philippinarum TaxID=129788 RepID=UPI00295BE028|nr:cysteinyl leukotriene receptor 1-like [Ruditapes philippinarum]
MPALTYGKLVSFKCDIYGYIECYVASWIWKVVPVTLVVVGIIGNLLNLMVLSSHQLRKKSTCVYLMFLAVTDMIVCSTGPLPNTVRIAFGTEIRSWSSFSCAFSHWSLFASGMMSCWIIVLVTAERTFVTLFPTTFKPKMTPRNAVIIAVVTLILVILLNAHLIYGSTMIERQINITENNVTRIQTTNHCSLRKGGYSEFYNAVWKKLLLILGSVVPLILIITGNAIVATSLIKSKRALRRVQIQNNAVNRNDRQSPRNNANYRMFFILCSVYVVTTVPYGLYLNLLEFGKEVDEHTLAKYQLLNAITRCLIWSNFSFNFLLYFMTGSLFRREFKKILESVHKSITSVTNRSVQPQNIQSN